METSSQKAVRAKELERELEFPRNWTHQLADPSAAEEAACAGRPSSRPSSRVG